MFHRPPLFERRILFVVPSDRFDEAQFYQTWSLLSERGAWLTAAGESPTGVAVGGDGNTVRLAERLDALVDVPFDAVVLIDATGSGSALEEPAAGLFREFARRGGVIAAFERSGPVLQWAGVVPDVLVKADGEARLAALLEKRLAGGAVAAEPVPASEG